MLGVAHVTKVFHISGSRPVTIGGSIVEDGKVLRKATFRVKRDDKVCEDSVWYVHNSKVPITHSTLSI